MSSEEVESLLASILRALDTLDTIEPRDAATRQAEVWNASMRQAHEAIAQLRTWLDLTEGDLGDLQDAVDTYAA